MNTTYCAGIPIYPVSNKFPNGRACPHCLWIEDDPQKYNACKQFRKGKNKKLDASHIKVFMSIPPDREQDFLGVTIFDNHLTFKNSFLCVLGVDEGYLTQEYKNSYHDYRNIASLLQGVTKFIEHLHYINKDIKNVRVVINSNNDIEKHNKKEHPHAWVTLMDDQEIVSQFFSRYEHPDQESKIGQVEVIPPGSWVNDTNINLNENECRELIRQTDSTLSGFLFSIISKKVGLKDNTLNMDVNFYLLLNYSCDLNCGIINGTVAIPTSEIIKRIIGK